MTASIPPPLACLPQWYAVTPVRRGDPGFGGRLPDGRVLPYADGRVKTPEERTGSPDLEDMMRVAYPRGPARAVTDPRDEPGRARVEPLFDATYGDHRGPLPMRRVRLGGGWVRVHPKIAPALERVAARLATLAQRSQPVADAILHPAGGYNSRTIAGTGRTSAHAWGIAIDIDPRVSDYWKWQKGRPTWRSRIPQAVIDAFESEGFIWGGRWYHFDTMHFEHRPELLDASCRPSS